MKEYTTTRQLMERYSVPGLVLRLGVPAMVGQVFNLLYSIVDRIFVGRIPGTGEQALAAIGICAPALTAISAFAYMVGIGGASLMSISLGQGNQRRARQALGNAFWLVIAIAVAVTAVLLPLHRPLLYLLGCSDALYPYAGAYFTIYLLGTVASLLGVAVQYALVDGLTAMGKVRYAFPLSVFRKLVYLGCLFLLPRLGGVEAVFYAGSLSDLIGAGFSAVAFFTVVWPRLRRELQAMKPAPACQNRPERV